MNTRAALGREARVRWIESGEALAHRTSNASWKVERQTVDAYVCFARSALYIASLGVELNKGFHTNLYSCRGLRTTFFSFLYNCSVRNGRIKMKIARSGIDRIVSSKSSVKSKPPRQLPAYGPNELSNEGEHDDISFMLTSNFHRMTSGRTEE